MTFPCARNVPFEWVIHNEGGIVTTLIGVIGMRFEGGKDCCTIIWGIILIACFGLLFRFPLLA